MPVKLQVMGTSRDLLFSENGWLLSSICLRTAKITPVASNYQEFVAGRARGLCLIRLSGVVVVVAETAGSIAGEKVLALPGAAAGGLLLLALT
ncbi:MAG: hypothetical protein F4234_04160, partial [Gammaproteobacteria bacterium]|nr:hypothetical protein [Gammaproteobacteria bacterium]